MEEFEAYDRTYSPVTLSDHSNSNTSPGTPVPYSPVNTLHSYSYSNDNVNPYANITTGYVSGPLATTATPPPYNYQGQYAQALQPPQTTAVTSPTGSSRASNTGKRRKHVDGRHRRGQNLAEKQISQARISSPPIVQAQIKEEEMPDQYSIIAEATPTYHYPSPPTKEHLDRVPPDLADAMIIMPHPPDVYPGPYTFYRDGNEIQAVPDPYGTVWFR